jgi:hypothetical protein
MLVLEEEDAERPLHSASVWVAACLFTLDPRVAPFHRYSTAIVSTFIFIKWHPRKESSGGFKALASSDAR